MFEKFRLKRIMRQTTRTTAHHPAESSVQNYLSGSHNCLILWGLSDSKTLLCAQNIANGIIQEGGLAKVFRCDRLNIEGHGNLHNSILNTLNCPSLQDFIERLPHKPTWLILDAIDAALSHPDNRIFLKHLIELSSTSNQFKLLLTAHNTHNVCSVLHWTNDHRRIIIVEPVSCCQWREHDIRTIMHDSAEPAVQLAIRAGCPFITFPDDDYLAARWELGRRRLETFLRREWSPAGAVSFDVRRLRLAFRV
jgi:hypothetical protein